ncbi:nucleotide disphospho-sugar-binding domain-containing protein [Streptomyces cyanogenus]|uniref:Desosaminyl transferase EryCIII n=1 Tax=Streptomyces cyanogenus TaxID=80860 RepID=A0ABX7TJ97_STRCY|nr:nucleotide disphospho-sugar-binding domain-containing protein [Streptomyces cyanogenus]QTD96709.1 Desosaminyl transferase EryCIII precursor [Streptomyces cyanogenus]
MRVLFTPMAWPTHYYQMVGLAWAFRAAGHDVRVAGHPQLADPVTRTGIIAVTAGGDYDLIAGLAEAVKVRDELAREWNVTGPGQFPPDVLRKLLDLRMVPHIRAAEDMAPDLVAFARGWRPDLVITDPVMYAAPLAAAAVSAPVVRHLWGPDMSRKVGLPGNGVSAQEDHRAAWPQELADLYLRHGAEPAADIAVRTLDTCPESLQVPGVPHRVAMRYTSYNGTAVAPQWLLEPAERPRICVTWGSLTTTMRGPEAFLVPRVVEALADLDVEVILALRAADRERLGPLPERMRVLVGMPLDLILPTCSAIIHQSGAGSTLTAALHGVPQVTVPQIADQGLVSERLAGTGAGIVLDGDNLGAQAVQEAVRQVLDSAAPGQAARRLRQEMLDQPTPSRIVTELEALVG